MTQTRNKIKREKEFKFLTAAALPLLGSSVSCIDNKWVIFLRWLLGKEEKGERGYSKNTNRIPEYYW